MDLLRQPKGFARLGHAKREAQQTTALRCAGSVAELTLGDITSKQLGC